MAKESGLGFTVMVDDSAGNPNDISNDITNHQYATPRAVQDVTGVDKSAMERLHLLADFSATLTTVFNDAVDRAHETLSDLDNVRTISFALSGQTLANEALITDYALTRAADGSFTASSPFVLADGTVPSWS